MHTDVCDAASGIPGGGVSVSGPSSHGYEITMTDAPDDRAESRAADLLPEERAAGSADPEAQAEALLEESDEREGDLEAAPDTVLEHRTSAQTITPQEDTR